MKFQKIRFRKMVILLFLICSLAFYGTRVFAESIENGESLWVALLDQQGQLDHQIRQVEQRVLAAQQQSSPPKGSKALFPRRIASKKFTHSGTQDEDVSTLEEYTVEDTYLDPFDEALLQPLSDPWEPFNSSVFDFNLELDRRVIRPVARGYHAIMPDAAEEALGNAFSNIRVVPRVANNVFQGKVSETGLIVGRFLINSTIGLAGLFDVAQAHFGLVPPAEEDAGQTLATLGVEPGPYLVLPLLPPTTVRDGIGILADLALDPLNYVFPFVAQVSSRVSETVNERAQHLETFQGIEDRTLDLYAAVRDAYGQTRAQAIRQ